MCGAVNSEPPQKNAVVSDRRERIARATVCLLLSLAVAVLASRGKPFLTPVSYEYAHQSLSIVAGEGLGGYHQWPPGYAILIAMLHLVGIGTLTAGWIISVASFCLSSLVLFWFTLRITSKLIAWFAYSLFVFNPLCLLAANMVVSESVFILSLLLGMTAACSLGLERLGSGNANGNLRPKVYGLLLGLPSLFRHIGIVFLLSCLAPVLSSIESRKHRWKEMTVVCALAGVPVMIVVLRNYFVAGSLFGHPITGEPGDSFFSALYASLRQIAAGVVLDKLSVPQLAQHVLVVSTGVGLVGIACYSYRVTRVFTLSLVPILYIIVLSITASITRIDVISWRFIVPVLPFLFISLSACLGQLLVRCRRQLLLWRATAAAATLFITIVVSTGSFLAFSGFKLVDLSGGYSPRTLEFICRNVPSGTAVAGSRYGKQLLAASLDYRYLEIPFEDPWNAGYTTAYGLEVWSRKSALDVFIEKNVRHIVFFLGSKVGDPFLKRGCYGSYVSSLVSRKPPEVASVEQLPDGIVLTLVSQDSLIHLANLLK